MGILNDEISPFLPNSCLQNFALVLRVEYASCVRGYIDIQMV